MQIGFQTWPGNDTTTTTRMAQTDSRHLYTRIFHMWQTSAFSLEWARQVGTSREEWGGQQLENKVSMKKGRLP